MLHQGLPRGIRFTCPETSRSGIEGTTHPNVGYFFNATFMPIILKPMEAKRGGPRVSNGCQMQPWLGILVLDHEVHFLLEHLSQQVEHFSPTV